MILGYPEVGCVGSEGWHDTRCDRSGSLASVRPAGIGASHHPGALRKDTQAQIFDQRRERGLRPGLGRPSRGSAATGSAESPAVTTAVERRLRRPVWGCLCRPWLAGNARISQVRSMSAIGAPLRWPEMARAGRGGRNPLRPARYAACAKGIRQCRQRSSCSEMLSASSTSMPR